MTNVLDQFFIQPGDFPHEGRHALVGADPIYDVRTGEYLVLHIDHVDDYFHIEVNGHIVADSHAPIPEGMSLNPLFNAGLNTVVVHGLNNPGGGWNFWGIKYQLVWYYADMRPVGRLPSIIVDIGGGPQDGGEFCTNKYVLNYTP